MKIPLKRIERWVWYLFLVSIPWQTRIILWQADSSFVEWRSAALYFSDLCMVALFVIAVIRSRGLHIGRIPASDWFLGFVFAAAVLSLSHAPALSMGLVALLRLLQYMLLYLYLRHWAWGRVIADHGAAAFVLGALLQAGLGIAQYLLQHDVGLRWLGETLLRTDMRGVAVFYSLGHVKILRAYGTLPHPNVLAAYLVAAVWVLIWLWLRHWTSARGHTAVWQGAMAVVLVGLYLTFSRTVIAVWVIASCLMLAALYANRISGRWPNIQEIRRRLRVVIGTVVLVSAGFALVCWPQIVARMTISVSDESVRQRLQYNADALQTGSRRGFDVNWTGVGIGNFTTWLSRYDRALPSFVTQPAHNIYLMMYSELGAVGLFAFLVWLATVARTAHRAYPDQPLVRYGACMIVVMFLVIGLLDHFFWTLQQGRILFWSALALAAGRG